MGRRGWLTGGNKHRETWGQERQHTYQVTWGKNVQQTDGNMGQEKVRKGKKQGITTWGNKRQEQ